MPKKQVNEVDGGLPSNLAQPAIRALDGAMIHDLQELSRHSEKAISKLHGLGPSALEVLRGALADKGLSFAEAPTGQARPRKASAKAVPVIEHRPAYPYAAVRIQVPIPFGSSLQIAWKKVNVWLAKQGLSHGPAIMRYLTTDMSTKLDIDVGFILDQPIPGGDGVLTDSLPAGEYACLLHTGSYRGKGVYLANVVMVEWAKENNVPWMVEDRDGVEWWNSRVEWYFNDPAVDPDPQSYKTELTFRVAVD